MDKSGLFFFYTSSLILSVRKFQAKETIRSGLTCENKQLHNIKQNCNVRVCYVFFIHQGLMSKLTESHCL